MAEPSPIDAYAQSQGSQAKEYQDAWNQTPDGGVGQFSKPTTGPFSDAGQGLTAASPPAPASTSVPKPPSPASTAVTSTTTGTPAPAPGPGGTTMANSPVVDALPETPGSAIANLNAPSAIKTGVSNLTKAAPYVGDVTDDGQVARQDARPERLAIDDTMSPDEQYRRQWTNESNGYYGTAIDKVAPPAAPAAAPPSAPAEAPKPVMYGVSFQGGTDASDGIAYITDPATGQVVKEVPSDVLFSRLGGRGQIDADQLKEYTGWSAPAPPAQAPATTKEKA